MDHLRLAAFLAYSALDFRAAMLVCFFSDHLFFVCVFLIAFFRREADTV